MRLFTLATPKSYIDLTQWLSPQEIKHLLRKLHILFSLVLQIVRFKISHLLLYDEISVLLHKERQQKMQSYLKSNFSS